MLLATTGTAYPQMSPISDPFGEAVVLLVQWRGGPDEPRVLLEGTSSKISLIFELVSRRAFKDETPRAC
jgi:hypothetical protein